MKTSSNAGALQRLVILVLLTSGHQARHLMLGEVKLATTERREVVVGDLELLCWLSHVGGIWWGVWG